MTRKHDENPRGCDTPACLSSGSPLDRMRPAFAQVTRVLLLAGAGRVIRALLLEGVGDCCSHACLTHVSRRRTGSRMATEEWYLRTARGLQKALGQRARWRGEARGCGVLGRAPTAICRMRGSSRGGICVEKVGTPCANLKTFCATS